MLLFTSHHFPLGAFRTVNFIQMADDLEAGTKLPRTWLLNLNHQSWIGNGTKNANISLTRTKMIQKNTFLTSKHARENRASSFRSSIRPCPGPCNRSGLSRVKLHRREVWRKRRERAEMPPEAAAANLVYCQISFLANSKPILACMLHKFHCIQLRFIASNKYSMYTQKRTFVSISRKFKPRCSLLSKGESSYSPCSTPCYELQAAKSRSLLYPN